MNKLVVNQIVNLLQEKVPQGYNQLLHETVASAKLYLIIATAVIIVAIAFIVAGTFLTGSSYYDGAGVILVFLGAFICLIAILTIIYNIGVLSAPNVHLINNLISN